MGKRGSVIEITPRQREEIRMLRTAEERFMAKVANPSYIRQLLLDAGIERAPCQLCVRQEQKTCGITVGDMECQDFIPYTKSVAKFEGKLLNLITGAHQHQFHLRQESKQPLAA